MISLDKKFLIVGLGLIGGCYASKLSSLGYKVYALDLNDDALEFGYSNSFILNKENDLNLVKECDYIILCLYPLDCIKWVKDNKYLIKEDCIVSDVSGVKSNYVRVIQNELENNEFVSMHPMAGKEKSGVFYSDYSTMNLMKTFLPFLTITWPFSKAASATVSVKLLAFSSSTVTPPCSIRRLPSPRDLIISALSIISMSETAPSVKSSVVSTVVGILSVFAPPPKSAFAASSAFLASSCVQLMPARIP